MFEAGPKTQGVIAITVRFSNRYDNPLIISFESYPDIIANKVIGPKVSTIDEACVYFRMWLQAFVERHREDNDEVTR